MKEIARITELFEDNFNGYPWIDVTLLATLENISVETAANKMDPYFNSIWEIVNHIIRWRETVLQRVQGHVIDSPENNYFSPVPDQSGNAWLHTLENLKNSQQQWIAFLQKMIDDDLEKIYKAKNLSSYKLIHGIIQHDAYHLGQIVLLMKLLKEQIQLP